MQDLKEQEIQGNVIPKNTISQANYKEMEICKLSNKAFKIVVLRKFTELQEKKQKDNSMKPGNDYSHRHTKKSRFTEREK